MKLKEKPNLRVSKKALSAFILSSCTVMSANAVIEEVIVTANKRAQNANSIGLSITALSGDKLAEQKLTSMEEITQSVPSLVFAESQQGTPILTLRGVGFNETSLGVYPAVSVYVDEIPLPFPVMAAHSSYDLERAEVLKGPQGVLFGQNSTGGAINFIAAKPADEFGYGVDISYGRFNKTEVNGYVTGGLSETVSARLAIQNVQSGDWQKNPLNGDENGEEDYTAARLSLRFEPSDTATINVNVNGWEDKTDPQALQIVAVTPKSVDPTNATIQSSFPLIDGNDARDAYWTGEQSGDKEFLQASVRGDFELSNGTTLTGLVARSDYEQDQLQDGDGSPFQVTDYRTLGDIESTFAEIRLAGVSDSLRWVVGANYEDSTTSEFQELKFGHNTSSRGGTLFIHRMGSTLEQDIESYAVFGNVDFDIAEDLTMKLGARYTDTTIEAESCGVALENTTFADGSNIPDVGAGPFTGYPIVPEDDGSNMAALFNFLAFRFNGLVPGVDFTPIGAGDCFSLNADGVPGFPLIDELAENNVSWRVGLDYQLNDQTLLYANVSQGYKAGSYPNLAANGHDQLSPVTEESVLSYEAGFKATLNDGSVQWNGAVFHYDYEDKQVKGKIPVVPFGPLEKLANVPESTITGIETDIVAQLTDKLTLTAAVTYLNSEIDEYEGFDVYGTDELGAVGSRDLSGNDLPFSPELTYSLDVDYRMPLDNGELFMGVNVIGQSDADAVTDGDDLSLANSPLAGTAQATANHKSITENYFVVEDYFTVGARIGYEGDDGRWKVMLWGKNLTDEYYWNSVIAASENAARISGRPRTYGISFSYKY